jgi:hypothetical protein
MHLNGTGSSSIPALFVSPSPVLRFRGRMGGVQICTREYMGTLREAGFTLRVVPYGPDQRLVTRIRKVLWPRPYTHALPPGLENEIVAQAQAGAEHIFLNLVDLAPLAGRLKARLGSRCRIVLLSHGLESVDYLHFLRAREPGGRFQGLTASGLATLARKLVAECEHRQHLDQVICLAPFEAEIERWLGARRVEWLPRTIPQQPVKWQPRGDRIGYVGTLDHPPNTEGLLLFLRALGPIRPKSLRVRLVGGPPRRGEEVARQFPFVDYLGALDDGPLHEEVATWNCFVHPMFCYARGCSTKLAVALGWVIPVVTTASGCRGYVWRDGDLSLAETPGEVAELSVRMLNSELAARARAAVVEVVRSSPTLSEVAARLRHALCLQADEVRL